MVQRQTLVRRLPTVETLGSSAVVCSDQIGTRTRDEKTAREVWMDCDRASLGGSGYAPEGEVSLAKDGEDWMMVIGAALRVIPVLEAAKWALRGTVPIRGVA
jgi:magnesium-transporting ATPase (P-type)